MNTHLLHLKNQAKAAKDDVKSDIKELKQERKASKEAKDDKE